MKKFLATLLSVCLIITSITVIPMSVFAVDENSTITVTDVTSFNQAVKDVANGGTIVVEGTIAFEDNTAHVIYLGSNTGKTYTITGGTLDFTAVNTNAAPAFINVHDNITFENITLAFDSEKNDFLFACGYNLTIAESVTFTGAKVCFYGGRYLHHNTVNKDKAINATLLAGAYTSINGASHASGYTIEGDVRITVGGNVTATTLNGGGNTIGGSVYVTVQDNADIKTIVGGGGSIAGDVHVVVKDNANPNSFPSDDSHNGSGYYIYGAGSGKVAGSTYVYFMDNAKSGYVVGGTSSESGSVGGAANVYIMGGTTYSVYGSGTKVAAGANASANIVMTGGTVWQIFGGAEATGGETNTSITGDITVKLLGGTVNRRVFGGSYNEYKILSWSSSHYINGTISLIIGENIDLQLNDGSDFGCSAHSRRQSVASGENGVVIYTSATAKANKASELDNGSAGGATHETTHVYSYALNGNVITQTCSEHSTHSATATVTPDGYRYTGEEIEATVVYSDNWEFERFDVAFTDNKNAGVATATLTIQGIAPITYKYNIAKQSQRAPILRPVNNTLKGLTTDMEYSTDGVSYTAVTDAAMTFEGGKYFVRYSASENFEASPVSKVFFNSYISANKASARPGDKVEIIINMPANTGIDALNLSVDFDSTALRLENVEIGKLLDLEFDEATNTFTWSGDSTSAKGVLAKLIFTVEAEATVNTDYAIALSQDGFTVENGSVRVVEAISGDVEDNGKIDAIDVVMLRNAFANGSIDSLEAGADVNGDGSVDAADLLVLRQYIASYNFDTGESGIVLGGAAQ